MKLALSFLLALPVACQPIPTTGPGPLAGASASLNVTVASLPNIAGGSSVNLTAATGTWKQFTRSSACQSTSECAGDSRLNGSGIMGLHTNGGDPNYQMFTATPAAISFSASDGGGGSGGGTTAMFWPGGDYTIRSFADNSVSHTLTIWYGLMNPFVGTNTKTGDGTANFTISLTDGSVAPQTSTLMAAAASGNGLFRMTIQYRSATDGQELVVRGAMNYSMSDGNTNLVAFAATLDGVVSSAVTRDIPIGADLQAEANDMFRRGDTQRFPAGFTWTGNLKLPAIPPATDTLGNPLHIKLRAADINLPAGQRVLLNEPTVVLTSPNTSPVLEGLGPNIGYWDFDGERFASLNNSEPNGLVYRLINFGLSITPDHTTTSAALPHDINFTHVVIHGRDPVLNGDGSVAKRFRQIVGIQPDVLRGSIADSNITNWTASQYPLGSTSPALGGQEANAITMMATDTFAITNNEVSSNGECILMNSAYSGISPSEAFQVPMNGGLMPQNVTISGNYAYKQIDWLALEYTKNLIECKTCKNTRITGNLVEYSFEGTYSDGQHGASIVVVSRNGGDGGTIPRPWSWTRNVEVDHNIQRHVGSCIQTSGQYDDKWILTGNQAGLASAIAAGMGTVSNINYHDNYCADISVVWTTPSFNYPTILAAGNGYYQAQAARWGAPDNSTIQRNTFLHRETPNATVPGATLYGVTYNSYTATAQSGAGLALPGASDSPQGPPGTLVGQLFDSNVFGWGDPECASHSSYGCFGDPANTTFTNNILLNVVPAVSSWISFLSSANATYPGRWTGNIAAVDGSIAPAAWQGAPASLLAGEAAIRAGNR